MDFQKSIENKVSALTVAKVNAAIQKYIQPYEKWSVVNAGDFK
jgi:zinc protease